ncbi:helix-turn-helix transcriptional regulator [Bradyrhizobium sp. BEA-2-5]|uniref:helix-turn-helix transcriptional regulator n=1 Tax=Bradyrhizobium sp. BEA-2-5 TaxID=3080015 RepID=UPI00293E5D29|nr:helix-turn-helix transcriptional regulator [Bradyrhizobium sp. BEA-2-5]WOH80352.1 helix-turn-helix transcriptional regulator [Bradyrhizobium sp. BEA-2-5]
MTNIPDTATLGTLVRQRRNALGLRQQDLALAANVGVRFIVDIENGKQTSQIGLVLRLLKALGISLQANMAPAPVLPVQTSDDDSGIFDPDNPIIRHHPDENPGKRSGSRRRQS